MIELSTIFDVIFYYYSNHSIFPDIFIFMLTLAMAIFCIVTVFIFNRIAMVTALCFAVIVLTMPFCTFISLGIFSQSYTNDIKIIDDYISEIEYQECSKKLVLYNENILRFSSIDYSVCINRIKTKKFDNEIKNRTNGVKSE